MKKNLLITVLLISFGTMFSQSRDNILNELSDLLKSNNNPSELYYNDADNILDLIGYQIPLDYIEYRYTESDGAMLGFQCTHWKKTNWIYDPKADEYFENLAIPMNDKESVYIAIDLIPRLRYAN